MKPPIFVYEPIDLGIFESVKEAELKVEPIDARSGEFEYYDADGRVLTASIATDENGVERTVIHERDEKIFDQGKLRAILLDFLIAVGESKFEIEHLSLEELVGRSIKFATH